VFSISEFVRICQTILDETGDVKLEQSVDQRTVRFYSTQGLLRKPLKSGRESVYDKEHVRQLVGIKLLQANGLSLATIKIKTSQGLLEVEVERFGVNLSILVDKHVKETEASLAPAQETEVMAKIQPVSSTIQKVVDSIPEKGSLTITASGPEVDSIRSKIVLGSSFAFLQGLDATVGQKVHRMLYGQKTKGTLTDAVLFVDENGLELPGCKINGKPMDRDLAALVCDKDVYKEADEVAQLFVFDPTKAKKQVQMTVTVDGMMLDTLNVTLDQNGCGMVRYPASACGRYKIEVVGSKATCSFEAARYTLAPLIVTLEAASRIDGEVIAVKLGAKTFGEPFDGQTKVSVISAGKILSEHNVAFEHGEAHMQFVPKSEEALSLRVQSKKDADMIAGVPLPGSSKKDREDTFVSKLGKMTSVSLFPTSKAAMSDRGLFFEHSGSSNSPLQIDSVVSKNIEVKAAMPIEMFTVAIQEPISGETYVEEVGSLAQNQTWKGKFDGVAIVRFGGLVDGLPWEGHAFFVKPTTKKVEISAPAEVAPGKVVRFTLKTNQKTSVMVRIADKRVRSQETALSSAASALKRCITAACLRDPATVSYQPNVTWIEPFKSFDRGPYGYGGGVGTVFGSAILRSRDGGGQVKGIVDRTPQMRRFSSQVMLSSLSMNDHSLMDSEPIMSCYAAESFSGENTTMDMLAAEVERGVEVKTSGGIFPKQKPKTVEARESTADIVWCGLVEVNKEKVLKVRMPDCVADFDITATAFAEGEWSEAKHDLKVTKNNYIEPMLPQFAHPDDKVACNAIIVGLPDDGRVEVFVNDKAVSVDPMHLTPKWAGISWSAVPGVHKIVLKDRVGGELDKVVRVVECPGEETVIGQEIRILREGENYSLVTDEDALSVVVLPGIEGEFKASVQVVTDFEHKCCEQTSACVTAACFATMLEDDAVREKAYKAIVNGSTRLSSMFDSSKHAFASYPGSSINEGWSNAAARRCARFDIVNNDKLPTEVQQALTKMAGMGKDILAHQKSQAYASEGPMETLYFHGMPSSGISQADVDGVLKKLSGASAWDSGAKSEAAYCAAALLKAKSYNQAISVVNTVAKAMSGTLGGMMHGTCEVLAYMYMMHEANKSGLVSGTGASKLDVNGSQLTLEAAMTTSDIHSVTPLKGACAIRINRLSRIRFDELKCGVSMSISVKNKTNDSVFNSGDLVTLTVETKGYKDGDVLCVALPDCLSRIISGTKTKKFQVDFKGQTKVEVDLVAGRSTERPQRWAAVVRNMYDGARVGSVGLLTAEVK
jgi:DNA-binding transcriptional MerR regulator